MNRGNKVLKDLEVGCAHRGCLDLVFTLFGRFRASVEDCCTLRNSVPEVSNCTNNEQHGTLK